MTWAIFALFLALLLGVGLWPRAKDDQNYLFAGRSISLFPLTATLVMTEFNTATLIAFSSQGPSAGRSALLLPLVFLIGLFFYAVTVARKWKQFDGVSVADFFTERFGRPVGVLASWSLLAAMAGFSAVHMKSLLLIFPIPSIFLLAAVVAMTLRGGLVSVIATDILSFFAVSIFLVAALIWTPSTASLSTEPLSGRFVVSLVILTIFTYILAPWYGQKMFAARTPRTALLAVLLSALIVFVLYGAAIWLTCRAQAPLPTVVSSLPALIQGLGYGVLFSASATSLAGVWNAMSGMLSSRTSARWRTLMCALLSYLLALTLVDSILDKLILANIPVAALSFALLAGFYWPRANAFGAYCSIAVGLLWGVGCFLFAGPTYTWPWAIYGIPLIFISGIAGSLAYASSPRARPTSSQ